MRRLTVCSILLVVAFFGACGGDDDLQAYCDAVAATEGQDTLSQEDIDSVRDSAPSEISSEIDTIADAVEEFNESNDPSVFDDPDFQEAVTATEEFEDENCE